MTLVRPCFPLTEANYRESHLIGSPWPGAGGTILAVNVSYEHQEKLLRRGDDRLIMFSAISARATSLYSTLGPSGQFDTANGDFVDGSNGYNQVIASPFSVSTTANLTNASSEWAIFGAGYPISLFVESNAAGFRGPI